MGLKEGDHVLHAESGAELVFLREVKFDEFIKPVLCASLDVRGARVVVEQTDLVARPPRAWANVPGVMLISE
ncbi:hypothetical protein [Microvirgula aerodenitrificans]|uniref:hypothetical protein n=1 Tax=Microvirgula aerodenitrificans TaxID=57480 RepID=UPI00248E04EC|nr:hypothetical protein [Microvirgula aerodenitrificans]